MVPGTLLNNDSDSGLSPVGRQARIGTNVDLLTIKPLRTSYSKISVKMHSYSLTDLKMSLGRCVLASMS